MGLWFKIKSKLFNQKDNVEVDEDDVTSILDNYTTNVLSRRFLDEQGFEDLYNQHNPTKLYKHTITTASAEGTLIIINNDSTPITKAWESHKGIGYYLTRFKDVNYISAFFSPSGTYTFYKVLSCTPPSPQATLYYETASGIRSNNFVYATYDYTDVVTEL